MSNQAARRDDRREPDDSAAVARLIDDVRSLVPRIRERAPEIERARQLTDDVVAWLRSAGVFRMATPRAYGGPELDPMTQVRVVEELSAADGSVGWNTMIGVMSGYVSARLEPEVVESLFAADDTLLAGQVAPLGRAELVDGGYRVSGHWRFGSASRHATVFMAGFVVRAGGEVRRRADGQPETRVALLRAKDVRIVDTWQTTGLAGTGSNDYEAEDVFVPFGETFDVFERARLTTPLYRLPLLFLANHAGIPLGIARNAIDTVVDLAQTKIMSTRRLLREEGQVQEMVARVEGTLGAARSYAYSVLEDMWASLCRGDELSTHQRAAFRIMMVHVHHVAKDIVMKMYDTAGTSAIFRTHPLDRMMRDILVACQHVVVQEKVYRPAGRMLLGLDPGDPFF